MTCWIYDEGGWPSGGACGKVLKDHPEYARLVLKFRETSFSAGDAYKKPSSDVVAAFIQDKEMIENGYSFTEDTVVTEYIIKRENSENADYTDLLNKDATEYFIKITHEKYASSMKNALAKNITAIFTDEPKAPSRAFNKELVEKYENLYGESILPHLPQNTQTVLERFIKGGGKVSRDFSDLPPVILVEGTSLRAMHRKTENAELFCLFRETGENGNYKIHLPSSKGYLLDPANGLLQHLETENDILELSLAIGETAVILLTEDPLNAETKKN